MNILVTGANGMLGKTLQSIINKKKDNYIFTDIVGDNQRLDITDLNSVEKVVRDNNIKCIINCAAWTNVDKAETAGDIVEVLNAKAPHNLAIAMKAVDGLLIHISTDYVFGGDPYNTPCREEQQGTPTGVYGLTKLHGEEMIKEIGGKYIIIRTAWLYSEFGNNFVKTMIKLTSEKPKLKVVFDQCGTPTYAADLANVIFNIIDSRKYEGNTGIYHYSNEGVCSWYDFAKNIAKLSGNNNCKIYPCHSDEFPSPVKRPAYSVFDKTKIKEVFGIEIPYWVDSLEKCIINLDSINN